MDRTGDSTKFPFPSDLRHRGYSLLILALLISLILFAALLRFYELGSKSLRVDEMRRVVLGTGLSPAQLWRIRSFQLPVYLTTRLAVLLGRNEFLARFPSAMTGILSIAMIYQVGKSIFGQEESLLAAFMLAAFSFHVRWSRDEGPYALMIFLSLLTLFFLLKALQESDKRKWWVGFTLASILNIYNHTYTLFVLASEMMFAGLVILENQLACLKGVSLPWPSFLKDTLRPLFPLFIVITITGLAYLPVVPGLFDFVVSASPKIAPLDVRPSSWSFYVNFFDTFGAGQAPASYILAGALLLGLFCSNRKQMLLALIWIALPLIVISRVKVGWFRLRFVAFIQPLCILVISRGVTKISGLLSRWISLAPSLRGQQLVIGFAITMMTFGSMGMNSLREYWASEENWRDIAAFLRDSFHPGDVIVVEPAFAVPSLTSYYGPDLENVQSSQGSLDRFQSFYSRHDRVWLVWLAHRFADPRGEIRHWMAKNDFITIIKGQPLSLYYSRKDAHTSQAQLAETIGLLETAIQIFPPTAQLEADLGDAYLKQGNTMQALAQYHNAIELNPTSGWYYIRLGDAYQDADMTLEALEAYHRAARQNPAYLDKAWYHAHLGNFYIAAGSRDKAKTAYEKAVELEPDNTQYRRCLDALRGIEPPAE